MKVGTIIQHFPINNKEKYKIRSLNGKKCVIFVDNFNLLNNDSPLF